MPGAPNTGPLDAADDTAGLAASGAGVGNASVDAPRASGRTAPPLAAPGFHAGDMGLEPKRLDGPLNDAPDNLTRIKGIGPTIERLLFEHGVYHYDQIAAWTDAEAQWIEQMIGFAGRVEREGWIAQAKGFAAEGKG